MQRIRVLIADEHPIVRLGIHWALASCPDLEIVGEVASGGDVEGSCERLCPDVLLLAGSMCDPGLLAHLRLLACKPGGPSVLVFGTHADPGRARRAIDSGAAGYLSKPRAASLLPEAIRAVSHGETFCSEVGEEFATGGAGRVLPHRSLSSREFEIFLMLGDGMRVIEIARELRLSPKTVSTHRARILEKTGLENNAAIVRYVNASGLHD